MKQMALADCCCC